MNNHTPLLRCGSIFLVVVMSLYSFLVTGGQVHAQATDYSITWQATDLIVATHKYPSYQNNQQTCVDPPRVNVGNPPNSEVAIGVAKWTVKGSLPGSTKFKELWSTPTLPNALTYGGTWNGSGCVGFLPKVSGNSEQQDWLYGFLHDTDFGDQLLRRSAMEFRLVPVSEQVGHHNLDPDSVANIGRTNSCQENGSGNDTVRCLVTTGPYSWVNWHFLQSAQEGKHLNAGTLIPLKWTVTGYLCEFGDNRCD